MLDSDDQDLVSRDVALPGLATVLDPERLAEELNSLGIEGVGPIELDYVRYKPGISCLVRFPLADADRPAHVVTYGLDASDKANKAEARSLACSMERSKEPMGGCAYARSSRSLFSFFPFDPDLPSVARLFDPETSGALRARIFRDLPAVPDGRLETLAYKPGRRFVARLCNVEGNPNDQAHTAPDPSAKLESRSGDYVLRFHDGFRRGRASRIIDRLHADEHLALPRRRGGSKRHGVAAVDWIEGSNLRDELRHERPLPSDLLERVAVALHALHAQTGVLGSGASAPSPAAGLEALALDLARLVPRLGTLAAQLASRLEAAFSQIEPMPSLVHGDFYDKQVVLCDPELDANERVGIIDLDELRLGDRREDLALCRAHWERDALLHQLERDPAALGDALLEGYRRHAVGALPSLDVFVAAGLFRLAPHPFRTRTRDWQAHVEALLLRASEILEQAE